jgi:hypothetical protein
LRGPTVEHCFPTRVSQNVVRGSARNHGGEKNKNDDIPRKIPNIPRNILFSSWQFWSNLRALLVLSSFSQVRVLLDMKNYFMGSSMDKSLRNILPDYGTA